MVDWMADYLRDIRDYPVKSQVKPGEIFNQIPDTPPVKSQPMELIMSDFNNIILPGITHWQHPNFHAYFNSNSSYPSVLAEMLTSTLAAQCMLWETSPAATELEEKMMEWLINILGLPISWKGVLQDGASTATLVSILSARELKSKWAINRKGFSGKEKFTIYCSKEAHSSVDKAVRIAGIGSAALRKIEVDERFSLNADALAECLDRDIRTGFTPLMVIATLGTTGSTAVDPVAQIATLCQKHQLWLHVDAAWAGTAMILPEYRWMADGLKLADSFVFNPHKWMFTNFDCSAYFVRDQKTLLKTFQSVPEYLKTKTKGVNNYSEWGLQLGRRFRALKLWFVIRNFGVEGLQKKVRNHIQWATELAEIIESQEDYQLLAPAPLSTICFRYHPAGLSEPRLDTLNQQLVERLNDTGLIYLTHTRLNGKYTIRLVVGQTYQQKSDIDKAWNLIMKTSRSVFYED